MIKKITEEITKIDFFNEGSIVYLIKLNNKNILVDTSSRQNKNKLIDSLNHLGIKPEEINFVFLTHAHYDHVGNISLFPNSEIYSNFTHSINIDHSKTKLKDMSPIEKQPIKEFTIYKTPGHTYEDIVILYKNVLFSGDVIFNDGYIGRTDFPESIPEKMKDSLKLISKLHFDILCPGH